MAEHFKDDLLRGHDHEDTHASATRWRHQESSSFAKHAALSAAAKRSRDADSRIGVSDLTDFLNRDRIEPQGAAGAFEDRYKPIVLNGLGDGTGIARAEPDAIDKAVGAQNQFNSAKETQPRGPLDGREVRCGPLINYRRMEGDRWFGSVLIVMRGGHIENQEFVPELVLRRQGERSGNPGSENFQGHELNATSGGTANEVSYSKLTEGANVRNDKHDTINGIDYSSLENGSAAGYGDQPETSHIIGLGTAVASPAGAEDRNGASGSRETRIKAVKLYADLQTIFWRFSISIQMEEAEVQWAYEIPGLRHAQGGKTDKQSFFVPSINESMRIMFHSCNGFSAGTDEDAWSGAALWNDVQRVHKETPFHVMIGGGDQIYNDGIRVNGPLRPWTEISNPIKRREYPFPEKLRRECDDYYVANYIRWYSTEPFAGANGQIPQLNLWDDHDIIDGFGSYVSEFMRCDVFRGIGGVAYKYYMLFQHHLAPPVSTYTTDAPQTMTNNGKGVGADPTQLKNSYVLENEEEDPSYIIGQKPGPYVAEHSRSIYARLGARIGFFGIDARTERTRKQVNYPETYHLIFDRLRKELHDSTSSLRPIQHLIVLLGIPIAYPRLTWLENIFGSPLMGPIKFLNKRFGFAGGFINHFDGSVDLLDDLDDHYTASAHKRERHDLILSLQDLAAEFSVRITILGGDVHLAAIGRFYSNPKLHIPISSDHRYMANIVSSAIVNKPPPQAIANLLARRNKLHHLDESTDETLMNMFDRDPGKGSKTASSNHVTMPSRNWAMLTECSPTRASTISPNTQLDGAYVSRGTSALPSSSNGHTSNTSDQATGKDGHSALGPGEQGAGTTNRAALPESHGRAGDGSLDVCIRVEKDQHDATGTTQSYGMWIPTLTFRGDPQRVARKRDFVRRSAHTERTDRESVVTDERAASRG